METVSLSQELFPEPLGKGQMPRGPGQEAQALVFRLNPAAAKTALQGKDAFTILSSIIKMPTPQGQKVSHCSGV